MSILCELSNVSRSGYYEWLKQSNKPDKDHEDYLKLKEIFDKSKSKYGWRSLKMRLGPDPKICTLTLYN